MKIDLRDIFTNTKQYFFKIILLVIASFCFNISWSQNVHFSQIFTAPVLINPSAVGDFDGNWRITNIIRSQGNNFVEPYTTNLIGFDKHINVQQQQLAVSIFMSNDLSAQNTLHVNQWYATVGYQSQISKLSSILFGLQSSFIYKNSSYKNLTLPEQFDMSTGSFNSNLQNSENFIYAATGYFDIASGVMWKYNPSGFETELGLAAFNLNKPRENFMGNKIEIPVKYVFSGSLKKEINTDIFIKPQMCYMWIGKASELIAGAVVGYQLVQTSRTKSTLYAGCSIRTGFGRSKDAMIFSAGLDHHNWNFCFSYDFDISGLHSITSHNNAIEFSVIYLRPNTFLNNKNVPCDLY